MGFQAEGSPFAASEDYEDDYWKLKVMKLLFPPPTEVFIYVSNIYLQSSGVIYILSIKS